LKYRQKQTERERERELVHKMSTNIEEVSWRCCFRSSWPKLYFLGRNFVSSFNEKTPNNIFLHVAQVQWQGDQIGLISHIVENCLLWAVFYCKSSPFYYWALSSSMGNYYGLIFIKMGLTNSAKFCKKWIERNFGFY
jgi:hypothetical protein